jgi:hypothetical protein
LENVGSQDFVRLKPVKVVKERGEEQ